MKITRQSGVTLLELMFTLALLAVVLGFGAPSMWDLFRNSRVAAETNDLVIGFHAGRSEAVKQRANVVLCASSNPTAEEPGCGSSFFEGWIVFTDRNGNGSLDLDPNPELSDAVVEAHGPMRSGLTVVAESNYAAFGPSGFARDIASLGTGTTYVLICDDRGNEDQGGGRSAARLIAISTTGRPQLLDTVADINARTGGCP